MKGKKQRQKVVLQSYRRNLSRTLSNCSVSQLVQLGSYKKRINDLSRNNRLLATALQEARVEAALQSGVLQNYAKNFNNILFARLKLNETTKIVAKLVTDLEEVRSYLNIDLTDINNPFTHKRGSPSDKICKEPTVNCIEEIIEEYSENEVVASENFLAVPDSKLPQMSETKQSNVCPRNSVNNVDVINEDIVVAPILFADDSEEKMKKSSSKSRSSKMCYDPDKGSLTPELNVDLTSVKLKRNSSRRQTQFKFPGSRSTSRGKITSSGKENSPEELITPAKPESPLFTHQKQGVTEIEKCVEEIFKSHVDNNIKENNFPEKYPKHILHTNQCNFSDVSTVHSAKNIKTVVASEFQPVESNHTVLLCEDMELTEVIPPMHQIVVGLPPKSELNKSNLDCNNTKMNSKNCAFDFSLETKDNDNVEAIFEKKSLALLNTHPNTSNLHNDIQLPEINELDEVQNVNEITFCEPIDYKNNAVRATNSFTRTRRSKPVKYAVFFSSDESDEGSPIKTIPKKEKTSKHKTISTEVVKTCKENGNIVKPQKAEIKMIKDDLASCTANVLHSKKKEKKSSKKLKDLKINNKNDLPKQSSKKCITKTKDENFKLNTNENIKKLCVSTVFSPSGILKMSPFQTTEEKINETAFNKANNNLEVSFENEIETPKSESRKVSFAPTDLVCNFRRMSVSKKIAENSKVNRTSKCALDFKETSEDEDKGSQTKTACMGADNFSGSTNNQQLNSPVFDFSGDTELFTFKFPSSSNCSTIPATDDLLHKSTTTTTNDFQKNANKNANSSKKVLPVSKPIKGKLSLKKNKILKNAEPQDDLLFEKVKKKLIEENGLLSESPVSISKPVKRKSLFKEHLDDNSKENIHFDHQIIEKHKNISQEKNKTHLNKNSDLSTENKCIRKSNNTKCQSKVQGKVSTKKLSDKQKLLESTPDTKKKKYSMALKSLENSPVLKNTINLPDMQDEITSKRRSKQISYKEPSLNKKLRRK